MKAFKKDRIYITDMVTLPDGRKLVYYSNSGACTTKVINLKRVK